MFYRVRIIKELGILVAIVLDSVISFITYTIWEIVGYAIAMAHMALITEFFDLIELWIFVQYHY
jgi:hypothetical protein